MTKNQIKDKKAIAVKALNNYGGIAIFGIEYGVDDYIVSAFWNGDKYDRARKSKVYYDCDGDYFKRYGNKYYLKDFIRI